MAADQLESTRIDAAKDVQLDRLAVERSEANEKLKAKHDAEDSELDEELRQHANKLVRTTTAQQKARRIYSQISLNKVDQQFPIEPNLELENKIECLEKQLVECQNNLHSCEFKLKVNINIKIII